MTHSNQPPIDLQPKTSNWKRPLYIIFLAQVVTMVGFSSVFPFLPLYVASLGSVSSLSVETLIGLVFSGQAVTMMIASPLWGALADRWGRKLMVVRATFGGAVILMAMAFVQSAEQLVVLRTIQGFITGVVGAANALVASTVPRERTGYAMGLMQVAVGIGIGIGPMIGGAVADAFGYSAAFFVTSAMLIVAGFVVVVGVEEPRAARPGQHAKKSSIWSDYKAILGIPAIPTLFALGFLNQLGRMIYVPILPLFVLALLDNPGQVNSFTGIMIGLSSAATALFSVFFGCKGDHMGHHRVFIGSATACALLFLLQSLVSSSAQLLVTQIVTGVALGGVVPSISALLAQYTRLGQEGAVYGLQNSINSAARAIGPMLGVAISGLLGLRAVFQSTAALYLITAIVTVFWLPPRPTTCCQDRECDKA